LLYRSIGSHCVAARYSGSIISRALTAPAIQGVKDEHRREKLIKLFESAVANIADHSPQMEPRSWAVLQPVLASVFSAEFSHEVQEKVRQLFQAHFFSLSFSLHVWNKPMMKHFYLICQSSDKHAADNIVSILSLLSIANSNFDSKIFKKKKKI